MWKINFIWFDKKISSDFFVVCIFCHITKAAATLSGFPNAEWLKVAIISVLLCTPRFKILLSELKIAHDIVKTNHQSSLGPKNYYVFVILLF